MNAADRLREAAGRGEDRAVVFLRDWDPNRRGAVLSARVGAVRALVGADGGECLVRLLVHGECPRAPDCHGVLAAAAVPSGHDYIYGSGSGSDTAQQIDPPACLLPPASYAAGSDSAWLVSEGGTASDRLAGRGNESARAGRGKEVESDRLVSAQHACVDEWLEDLAGNILAA